MILKIIRKDITAYGLFIFIGFISQLLFSSVMIIYARDDSWRTFVFVGCVQISTVILFFLAYEKMRNYHKLLFSLPLTKNQIVLSRYIGAILISLLGLVIWYTAAAYINSNFISVPDDFHKFESFKTVSTISIFFSFFISLFVPLTIKTKQVLVLAVPLILVAYIYVKLAELLKPFGDTDIQVLSIVFILVIISVPLTISYITSLRLIKNMDIV